jgi:hypothetical protein
MSAGNIVRTAAVAACVATLSAVPAAAQKSTEELARAAQNPVANMISLPFQNNTNFGYGPDDDIEDVNVNGASVWETSTRPSSSRRPSLARSSGASARRS